MTHRGSAIVLGAGVVGVTTAWSLAESGWRVELLDSHGVGLGTSLRNGGQLSYRYVAPLADTGVPLKALRWLMQRDGPLRWRPAFDGQQWAWLLRFLALCNRRDHAATAHRLARLGQYSRQCLHRLMHEHGVEGFGWEQAGKLVLHRSALTLRQSARGMDESQELWDAQRCLQHEPVLEGLAGRIAGGIYSGDEAVADCHAFCRSLMRRLESHPNFRGLSVGRVLGIRRRHDRMELSLQEGSSPSIAEPLAADAVVLAAGIASVSLAAPLGVRLPLYPLKGYSLDMPIEAGHRPPRASITDLERKVLYARIDGRLRVAAMVDLVGHDPRIDQRRLDSLLRVGRTDLPEAGDYSRAQPWAGLRPATPSGAPIVGPCAVPGLWLNVGHGALGFTLACASAELLAAQMAGQPMPEPLRGLDFSA